MNTPRRRSIPQKLLCIRRMHPLRALGEPWRHDLQRLAFAVLLEPAKRAVQQELNEVAREDHREEGEGTNEANEEWHGAARSTIRRVAMPKAPASSPGFRRRYGRVSTQLGLNSTIRDAQRFAVRFRFPWTSTEACTAQ